MKIGGILGLFIAGGVAAIALFNAKNQSAGSAAADYSAAGAGVESATITVGGAEYPWDPAAATSQPTGSTVKVTYESGVTATIFRSYETGQDFIDARAAIQAANPDMDLYQAGLAAQAQAGSPLVGQNPDGSYYQKSMYG